MILLSPECGVASSFRASALIQVAGAGAVLPGCGAFIRLTYELIPELAWSFGGRRQRMSPPHTSGIPVVCGGELPLASVATLDEGTSCRTSTYPMCNREFSLP